VKIIKAKTDSPLACSIPLPHQLLFFSLSVYIFIFDKQFFNYYFIATGGYSHKTFVRGDNCNLKINILKYFKY